MEPQQVLEESIERMNIWSTKHPSGTLLLTGKDARLRVIPEGNGWLLKKVNSVGNAELIGAFTHDDIQKLVHKILKFSWYEGMGDLNG